VSLINSWMREEWDRLSQLQGHEAIARDAADVMVSFLNRDSGLALTFCCAPDTVASSGPAPDCLYKDGQHDLRLAIEVTRLYDPECEECEAQWERFLDDVAPAPTYRYVIISPARKPPSKRGQRLEAQAAAAKQLAEAVARGEESANLDQAFGFHFRVGGLGQGSRSARTRVHVVRDWPGGAPRDVEQREIAGYVRALSEADDKLRSWREDGCETMLLFDCRWLRSLPTPGIERFRDWHEQAHQYNVRGWGDPRRDGGGFQHEDFEHVDHVLIISLRPSGVVGDSVWQRPGCQLRTATGFTITPESWHDDRHSPPYQPVWEQV